MKERIVLRLDSNTITNILIEQLEKLGYSIEDFDRIKYITDFEITHVLGVDKVIKTGFKGVEIYLKEKLSN